jgi:hypothetical protein
MDSGSIHRTAGGSCVDGWTKRPFRLGSRLWTKYLAKAIRDGSVCRQAEGLGMAQA